MADRVLSPRVERRAVAAVLAAELGHDLQGPFNLFRLATDRLERGEALDGEDVSLLREELERLSRLTARLRLLAHTPLQKVACTPRELLELTLARPGRRSEVEVEIDTNPSLEQPSFVCDPELLSQALGELIDNALEARAQRAGVRLSAGAAPGFCVWDDGPGFEVATEKLLGWGVTTRTGAAGLGLTLALRMARAHGFNLELRRVASLTEAWLLLPARGAVATVSA
jgi:signal transduction histidine kinase